MLTLSFLCGLLLAVVHKFLHLEAVEVGSGTRVVDHESVQFLVMSDDQDIQVAHGVELDGFLEHVASAHALDIGSGLLLLDSLW